MIKNRIYEHQNLFSLQFVSFLVGLRTYQQPGILFDGENISFDAGLVIYINITNIPPIMIKNRIYEHQNLFSLQLVSFLVGLRTYQHPGTLFYRCATAPVGQDLLIVDASRSHTHSVGLLWTIVQSEAETST
jgi:hypothetical protein